MPQAQSDGPGPEQKHPRSRGTYRWITVLVSFGLCLVYIDVLTSACGPVSDFPSPEGKGPPFTELPSPLGKGPPFLRSPDAGPPDARPPSPDAGPSPDARPPSPDASPTFPSPDASPNFPSPDASPNLNNLPDVSVVGTVAN